MLKTYFEEVDAEAAATTIKELKPPRKFLNELVSYVILESLDKNDNDRDNISKLICEFKKEGVITSDHFMEVSVPCLQTSPHNVRLLLGTCHWLFTNMFLCSRV